MWRQLCANANMMQNASKGPSQSGYQSHIVTGNVLAQSANARLWSVMMMIPNEWGKDGANVQTKMRCWNTHRCDHQLLSGGTWFFCCSFLHHVCFVSFAFHVVDIIILFGSMKQMKFQAKNFVIKVEILSTLNYASSWPYAMRRFKKNSLASYVKNEPQILQHSRARSCTQNKSCCEWQCIRI